MHALLISMFVLGILKRLPDLLTWLLVLRSLLTHKSVREIGNVFFVRAIPGFGSGPVRGKPTATED